MTTRNFDALFSPKTIALIGASNQQGSVGEVLARNLLGAGFRGPILTVNPHETAIRSTLNYRRVEDLPVVPDLAVIATPPATVPALIDTLGKRGCRAAIVITAGFQAQGSCSYQELLNAARPYLLRVIGPNCLGFISPAAGINASFAHLTPKPGDIAFVTQSGAIATTMMDWAAERSIGFSHLLSLGDMSDVDFGDALDYLAQDNATRAILLYVEMITNARKFMSAARIAARAKPVIVVKAGRSQAGAQAALSHTGALAGSDAVYDAAFRRAGILRVSELRDLFDAAETLSTGLSIEGDRLAIVTNGGGLGVLAADALELEGGHLAELNEGALNTLNAVLPKFWSHRNPVDILGDAPKARYQEALTVLSTQNKQDAILVMNCPTGVSDGLAAADAVLDYQGRSPLLTCWVGGVTAKQARQKFSSQRIPAYETPTEAVRAFMHLVDFRRNQELLLETPRPHIYAPDTAKKVATELVNRVLEAGRTVLTAPEAKELLSAYGISTVQSHVAKDAHEAAAQAALVGAPIALKILSPDITHKSDVGGVRLNLESEAVERAATEMLVAVKLKAPDAKISGFTIEPMIDREHAHELILGMSVDQTFGPVLMVGQGGVAVEVVKDHSFGLPPLNSVLARDMISRTRISKLLCGYRDVPPADIGAVADILTRLSDLVTDLPAVREIDINPLLVDHSGARALDARIVVARNADARLSIRPYPSELERSIRTASGLSFDMRPIRPSDEKALVDMVAKSSPEDRRMRFFGGMNEIQHNLAARLSQIDYDREMAFVAFEAETGALCGIVRLVCDPNFESGEFAVIVRTDFKGRGLGHSLMEEILSYAKSRGLQRIWGLVMRTNQQMLDLGRSLGARSQATASGADLIRLTFDVGSASSSGQKVSYPLEERA